MRRSTKRSTITSGSVLAIASMLAACSQPASHAIVDLSGSYGKRDQVAYSARTGAPVYASPTALYGPQSFPDYVPNSQLAYSEAPTNQVASLGGAPGRFDTYGVTSPAEEPSYSKPVWTTPVLSEAPLPTSPGFEREVAEAETLIQVAPYDPREIAAPAPVQTQQIEQISDAFDSSLLNEDYGDIYSAAPKNTGIEASPLPKIEVAPVSAPKRQIESAPLPDLISGQMPPRSQVADDYVTWKNPTSPQDVSPAEKAPLDMEATYKPQAEYLKEAGDLFAPQAQPTRMPAPQSMPNRVINPGGSVPKASDAYPRPYELLRPGIYPEIGTAGQGMVQAPSVTPMPVIASAEPVQTVLHTLPTQHASVRSYTIQPGDTLYSVAQRSGLTLEALAAENGLPSNAALQVGRTLRVPGRQSVEMVSLESAPSHFSSTNILEISGDVARQIMAPTSQYSAQNAGSDAKRFAWPVHGEVYKLASGQIEIVPRGKVSVTASAPGRVVHVEGGPRGVLVVVEHPDGWRSLTLGLEVSHVRVGEAVSQGSLIGRASKQHRVRFELRDANSGVANALAQLQG